MNLRGEDKAGLYITVSVHLAVIIVLLLSQIGSMAKKDEYLFDFSASMVEDENRPQIKDAAKDAEEDLSFEEEIARRIEQMISGSSAEEFRNFATDRSSTLKDDRGTDAQQLYEDARRLAQELKDGIVPEEPDDFYANPGKPENAKPSPVKEYSGPALVSYHLEGRKASHLPTPGYTRFNAGMITVIITVDNAGKVIDAKIQEGASSKDKNMRNVALEYARRARFSRNPNAPARQQGDIIYQFLAQ